jgi:two-component system phosphate regulon response regulator PhoB
MSPALGRVLVIDDDEWIVSSTAMVLEAEGLDVSRAKSGEEGIEVARRERPAVILLDIMMPGLDGWETLERLKTDEATRDIPVVIFSARELSRGNSMSRERGAEEFMRKPFEPGHLVDVIRKHLERTQVAHGEN